MTKVTNPPLDTSREVSIVPREGRFAVQVVETDGVTRRRHETLWQDDLTEMEAAALAASLLWENNKTE